MNFIIFETDDLYVQTCRNVIFKMMCNSNLNYKTLVLDDFDYNNVKDVINVVGSKIYIINGEYEQSIDLISAIRYSGDLLSPIIVLSIKDFVFSDIKKSLMFNLVIKDEKFIDNLNDNINMALKVSSSVRAFSFYSNGEMYRIPCRDILYIEKISNDNISVIHTLDKVYQIRKSIKQIEGELFDIAFFKTHRSCIVNMRNVTHVDFEKGLIFFNNKSISLISRSRKRLFKEMLYVI